MPPAGFEPAIPAVERLQTHALDSTAIGIGKYLANAFEYEYLQIKQSWIQYHNHSIGSLYSAQQLTLLSNTPSVGTITHLAPCKMRNYWRVSQMHKSWKSRLNLYTPECPENKCFMRANSNTDLLNQNANKQKKNTKK